MKKYQQKYLKIVQCVLSVLFLLQTIFPWYGFAQTVFSPTMGHMVSGVSPAFYPASLVGMEVFLDDPFRFNFIADKGDADLDDAAFKIESEKLIKYFLATLTIPEQDQWVNLSPFEKDRIIPESLAQTDMGRDMLAQDYLLKKITAALVHPDGEIGSQFWDRVYQKSYEQFGTTEISMDAFNKVWIVPERAVVLEKDRFVFVIESKLKVMLEQDYLAQQENQKEGPILPAGSQSKRDNVQKSKLQDPDTFQVRDKFAQADLMSADGLHKSGAHLNNQPLDTSDQIPDTVSSQLLREIVIPELEKEVNQGVHFAGLRQIYHSMILAAWFKRTLKESILYRSYGDQVKIKGLDIDEEDMAQKIYDQYIEAFKKGTGHLIRVEFDPRAQQHIPRRYFSGGVEPVDPDEITVIRPSDMGKFSSSGLVQRLSEGSGFVTIAGAYRDPSSKALAISSPMNTQGSDLAMVPGPIFDKLKVFLGGIDLLTADPRSKERRVQVVGLGSEGVKDLIVLYQGLIDSDLPVDSYFEEFFYQDSSVDEKAQDVSRGDLVFSLMDPMSVVEAFKQWKQGFDRTRVGGKYFSALSFSDNEQGQQMRQAVSESFERLSDHQLSFRLDEEDITLENGQGRKVLYVYVVKHAESMITIKELDHENASVNVHYFITERLTSEIVRNISISLPLGVLSPGVRLLISKNITPLLSSQTERSLVYGIKALVQPETGQVVFFSRGEGQMMLRHQDIAQSYFGTLKGIIGYQLQIVFNSSDQSFTLAGAQVDSNLQNMQELYDPSQGGVALNEDLLLKASHLLLKKIGLPLSEEKYDRFVVPVHLDLAKQCSDYQILEGKPFLGSLEIFYPNFQISTKFFSNKDNVERFYLLLSSFIRNLQYSLSFFNENQKTEKEEIIKSEWYRFGYLVLYWTTKSYFSQSEESLDLFRSLIKYATEYYFLKNDPDLKKEEQKLADLEQRIISIIRPFFKQHLAEYSQIAGDVNNLIRDPAIVLQHRMPEEDASAMRHDLVTPFNGYLGFADIAKEAVESGETEDIVYFVKQFLLSRKNYHDIVNYREIEQSFTLNEKSYEVIGFNDRSNPKETRKVLKPFFSTVAEGMFRPSLPRTVLREGEYLYIVRPKDKVIDEEPVAIAHITREQRPVINEGNKQGMVVTRELPGTSLRDVYVVHQVRVNPRYANKKDYKLAQQLARSLFLMITRFHQERYQDTMPGFLYEVLGEVDKNRVKSAFPELEHPLGSEKFLSTAQEVIDTFIKKETLKIQLGIKRGNISNYEDIFYGVPSSSIEGAGSDPGDSAQISSSVVIASSASRPSNDKLGGIHLGADQFDLEVMREGEGVLFSPQAMDQNNVQGLTPVIFQILPLTNLPFLMGVLDQEIDVQLSKMQ